MAWRMKGISFHLKNKYPVWSMLNREPVDLLICLQDVISMLIIQSAHCEGKRASVLFSSCDISVAHTNTFHRKPWVSLPRTESSVTTAYRAERKHFLFLVLSESDLCALVKPLMLGSVKTERKQMSLCLNFALVRCQNHGNSFHLILSKKIKKIHATR